MTTNAWTEKDEKAMNLGIEQIRETLDHVNVDMPTPVYIETMRLVNDLINALADAPDASEWFDEIHPSPQAVAFLLEGCFPMGPGKVAKRFWFEVAENLGKEYSQGVYHAAVFMTKVA